MRSLVAAVGLGGLNFSITEVILASKFFSLHKKLLIYERHKCINIITKNSTFELLKSFNQISIYND